MRYSFTIILLSLIFGAPIIGQEILLTNPSFEDEPRRGSIANGFYTAPVEGYNDCGIYNFPGETPHDVHPNGFWENYILASDGDTYVGLVVRDNDTYESISQKLNEPLKANQCYYFEIDICKSPDYWSLTRANIASEKVENYTTPIVLRLWGGVSLCKESELLAESDPVDNHEWKSYSFKIEPTRDIQFITLEAYYKTPLFISYNGHLLLDNASSFKTIQCEEELPELIAEAQIKKKIDKANKPKPKKKAKPEKSIIEPVEIVEPKDLAKIKSKNEAKSDDENIATAEPKEDKRILKELDTKNLKEGQTIRIEELFFEADADDLKENSHPVLNEIYAFLNQNPNVKIEVGGHTNGIPDHEYCNFLSTKRAKAVASYLTEKGIEDSRISIKGYGKRKPIASNASASGRKKNQRVELKILST